LPSLMYWRICCFDTNSISVAHPHVLADFGQVCPQMPTVLRRAAIHAASGAIRSHLSNLKRWETAGRKGKRPSLPHPHPHLTMYQGAHDILVKDFRDGYIRLFLFDGKAWGWHNIPVQAPPYAQALLEESEREKTRTATARTELRQQMETSGRTVRIPDQNSHRFR
jgi:hypothetical protein